MIRIIIIMILLSSCSPKVKNIIFFHPDGMGLNTWNAARQVKVGPDGRLNYDKIDDMAIYLGHMKNSLTATSHGAATTHAYGEKVHYNSFGMDLNKEITDKNGKKKLSIIDKAKKTGRSIAIVNSGTITEPGTAAFIASVKNRSNHEEIAKQIIDSDIDIILGGGEKYFLPKGFKGRYGKGARKDNINLIELAKKKGYKVIYTREELLNLPKDAGKILGLFAAKHTFNDLSEEELQKKNLQLFIENTPTITEMTEIAIKILANNKKGFLLISEEESTDNFGNNKNASGVIKAAIRADNTIGKIMSFIDKNNNSVMITTSDSDAGGMQIIGYNKEDSYHRYFKKKYKLHIDGINLKKDPFKSKKDQYGKEHEFYILWSGKSDVGGGILVKSYGKNSHKVKSVFDNTDIYNFIDEVL